MRTTKTDQTARMRRLIWVFITKTSLYNFDPLKPHFYIVKLGFTGVYITFLIFAQNHRLWVLVRTASLRRSNEYLNLCFELKYEKHQSFFIWNFSVFGGEISIHLNRRVFVMLLCAHVWRYVFSCCGSLMDTDWLLLEPGALLLFHRFPVITRTYLYNFHPLKPHFYRVKLWFKGEYLIICLISAQNINCGYSSEPPQRGGSDEYPQSMFWA